MSSFVRNLILIASCAAFMASAVRGIAALPEALHGAGLIAPQAWEEMILKTVAADR